jgi:preprotein translocase SecE subunit
VAFQIYKNGQGQYVRVPTAIGIAIVLVVLCTAILGILDRRLPTESKALSVEWELKGAARKVLGGDDVLRLKAEYFEGKWEALPDFAALTSAEDMEVRSMDVASFGHGNYGVVYTGEINVQKPGDYKFLLNSHDGSRLTIAKVKVIGEDGSRKAEDKAVVVADDGQHGLREKPIEGLVELDAGLHPFRLEYFRTLTAADAYYAMRVYLVYGIPALVFVGLALVLVRLFNRPSLVDFLIATESEMKKVSWSGRAELIGSTIVVIVTVFLLALVVFLFDTIYIQTGYFLRLW